MTVNPNLAALMRVIEDNQDKMPEGEYLEAMNALGALHRDQQQQRAPLGAPIPPAIINGGAPPSYAESFPLFASSPSVFPSGMAGITEQRALERVKCKHPDPFWNRLSPAEWIVLSYETRYELLREATEHYVAKRESDYRNPKPESYSFIARHSVGLWDLENNGECQWECVCGYTGKVKNWQKHEQGERHQEWAKHRTVSRRKIQKMKEMINDDEAGYLICYAVYGSSPGVYPGGIRYYPITQERNEWTNPELFMDMCDRFPKPTEDGLGETRWFIQPRNVREKEYVQ